MESAFSSDILVRIVRSVLLIVCFTIVCNLDILLLSPIIKDWRLNSPFIFSIELLDPGNVSRFDAFKNDVALRL